MRKIRTEQDLEFETRDAEGLDGAQREMAMVDAEVAWIYRPQ